MTQWQNQHGDLATPITVDIAMYGGERAGKTSLLASMYSSVLGEVRKAGLGIRRANPDTIRLLDESEDALRRLPAAVRDDPTLSRAGVVTSRPGVIRQFDFVLHGSAVDVAALRFYDFSGEDILHGEKVVVDAIESADIILVAINTPVMMEAWANSDLDRLHARSNVPDQLALVLENWTGAPPLLVMLCPIKCERWLHDEEESKRLNKAVHEMYDQILNMLQRKKFSGTTVVIAPVETVGSVTYDGYELYNPEEPPHVDNLVLRWVADESVSWAPRYHEQPFRWGLLAVTRAVSYGTIAAGQGGSWWQKTLARVGEWWTEWDLPKINAVEEFWRDQTGLVTFREATRRLADGRRLGPPFELIRDGKLMEPIDE